MFRELHFNCGILILILLNQTTHVLCYIGHDLEGNSQGDPQFDIISDDSSNGFLDCMSRQSEMILDYKNQYIDDGNVPFKDLLRFTDIISDTFSPCFLPKYKKYYINDICNELSKSSSKELLIQIQTMFKNFLKTLYEILDTRKNSELLSLDMSDRDTNIVLETMIRHLLEKHDRRLNRTSNRGNRKMQNLSRNFSSKANEEESGPTDVRNTTNSNESPEKKNMLDTLVNHVNEVANKTIVNEETSS